MCVCPSSDVPYAIISRIAIQNWGWQVRAYGIGNVTLAMFTPYAWEREDRIQHDWNRRVSEQKVQRQFCDTLFDNILKRTKNMMCYVVVV